MGERVMGLFDKMAVVGNERMRDESLSCSVNLISSSR